MITLLNLVIEHVSNNRDIVELLIDMGADMEIINKDGMSALALVCLENNEEMFNLLINRGANINPTEECITPLMSAQWTFDTGYKRQQSVYCINNGQRIWPSGSGKTII